MNREPVHTQAVRPARRRDSRRPASRTIARFGLIVSVPGASVLAATAGPAAVAEAGTSHGHHPHASTRPAAKQSPLVAMRKILEAEKATPTTTTTTTAPAPAPTTTVPAPAPHPAPVPHPVPVAPPTTVARPAPAPTRGIVPPA
ncbi:MAG TPA: hypothetical protein VN768_06380, partial [Acidimicrobiales bacterium]|nr:hypothetical protein [Acidimicrobiales bacterium]